MTLRIWHERFGHANVDYILKTSRLNAVYQKPSIRTSKTFFWFYLVCGTPRPLRENWTPKLKGYISWLALETRGYRVWIPEDSKVIETSNVRFQKPQQSNGGAVLASPNLKFSDYEVSGENS
ncbi:hypothetical protein TNCV_4491421 [Trichonephila clavipes]|nr:hypothetical protein TNCV_4491421 [Trichonephila clavipes]